MPSSPIDTWHGLLRPDVELTENWWEGFADRMRAARLTFGERLNCPFLRPFFLHPDDVARVTPVAEAVARLGERVATRAAADPLLQDALGLSEAERRLVAIDPGYGTASTASRLDAFLLPGTLGFAEYNAESPAGLGYTETLAELFDDLDVMKRFRQVYDADHPRLCDAMLDALLASYREWGGRASPPVIAIVDWREVPTWNEFQILRERFERRGVPTVVADPRDLVLDRGRLRVGSTSIDLLYRRVLINDVVARSVETETLVEACRTRAVCMANTFRCKAPHKKAFFAVLTDPRWAHLFTAEERAVIAPHVPWTRVVGDVRTMAGDQHVDLLAFARTSQQELVLKPNDDYGGHGVVLGWETTAAAWDEAIERAVVASKGSWIVQQRIPVRREAFAHVQVPHRVLVHDMLVDFAPYLFRGRVSGFLTRLSATGLANVTSGGGQVPSFIVSPRAGKEPG